MVRRTGNIIRISGVYLLVLSLLLCVSCAKKEFFYFSAPKASVNSPHTKWKSDSATTLMASTNAVPQTKPVSLNGLPLIASVSSSSIVSASERHKKLSKLRAVSKWKDRVKEFSRQDNNRENVSAQEAKQDKLPVPAVATLGFWAGLSSFIFTLIGIGTLGSGSGLFFVSMFLLLTGGVLSLIAKRKIKTQPDKFTGIKRARTGFFLSMTSFLLWLLLFVLIVIAFSGIGY